MAVVLSGLSKTYRGGVHALQAVNLTIPSGMFGLLGPNGAGKTTLMRILAGVLHPTGGSVQVGVFDGASERGRAQIKRILGYLPQEFGVYPDLSAREFLDYIAILKGLDNKTARRQRVEELLEMVALTEVSKRKLKTFSGGMKRRVGIAQALLNDPQLLIVDEPTAGLDPEERIRFRNLLADLGGDRTVLLSTHIVEDIAQTCQQLAVMNRGQVIFQGPVTDLLRQAEGYVWSLTTMAGARPGGNLTIVSTVNQGGVIQYRVVGEPEEVAQLAPNAQRVEPGLEDGYVWLMREQRQPSQPFAGLRA